MKRIGLRSLSFGSSTLLLTALVSVAACSAPADERGPGRHYGANRNYTEYDVVLSGRY